MGDWAVPVWHMPFQSDPSPAEIKRLHTPRFLWVLRHVSILHFLWRNSSTSGPKTHWRSCIVASSVPHWCGQLRRIVPRHFWPHCTPDHCWPHLRRTHDQARALVSMATCSKRSEHASRQSFSRCQTHYYAIQTSSLPTLKAPKRLPNSRTMVRYAAMTAKRRQ